MKRKEEIIQTARQKEKKVGFSQFVCEAKGVNSAYGIGFLEGAKWSDETMIEKACQWIENYLFDLGYPDDWCRDSPNIESGKERFIKAMKGE